MPAVWRVWITAIVMAAPVGSGVGTTVADEAQCEHINQ
ncbi:exported hypothetical protein [Rhodococcus sp. RD6.2]|nr:exported hypothetical protein [Rhodococcus sp. RD6.2]